MEFFWILQSRAHAPSFFRADMQDNRRFGILTESQIAFERADIMPVDWAYITHSVLFEERRAPREQVFDLALGRATEIKQLPPAAGFLQEALQAFLRIVIGPRNNQAAQHLRHGADIPVDGPFVVVQDDDETLGRGSQVIQGLHGYPAGKRRVADHRHDVRLFAQPVTRVGQADRRRKRRPRMPGAKDIVRALFPLQKTVQAAGAADMIEVSAVAAGQQFMDIALVRDVEDELIRRCMENPVQGYGEFHDAEVRTDVPAILSGDRDQPLPDFLC